MADVSEEVNVYLVVSEECYGSGILGVFSTFDTASDFVDSESERLNLHCKIYRTVLDNPSKLELFSE
mgnify:CR=1